MKVSELMGRNRLVGEYRAVVEAIAHALPRDSLERAYVELTFDRTYALSNRDLGRAVAERRNRLGGLQAKKEATDGKEA